MTHDDILDAQPGDGTDLLCQAIYLRPAHPRDYIGGSNCRMLRDAAATLTDLRRENARLKKEVADLNRLIDDCTKGPNSPF